MSRAPPHLRHPASGLESCCRSWGGAAPRGPAPQRPVTVTPGAPGTRINGAVPAQGRRGRAWAHGLWGWTCGCRGQVAAPSGLLGGAHWVGQTSFQTAGFRAGGPVGSIPGCSGPPPAALGLSGGQGGGLPKSLHCCGSGGLGRPAQAPAVRLPLVWWGDLCPRGQPPSLSPSLRGGSHYPHGIWLWAGGQAVMEAPLGEARAHQAFLGGLF